MSENILHSLPCKIQYSGKANISTYFKTDPSDSHTEEDKHNLVFKSNFRGRQLTGMLVSLPDNYTGIITDESLKNNGSFNKIMAWGHDSVPNPNTVLKTMQLLQVTNDPEFVQPNPIGVELKPGKDYWYCSCGKSKNQPFCDGSHKGTGLTPVKFTVAEEKKYWLCGCKQTENSPFCDGTHSKEKGVKKYNEFLLKKNIELNEKLQNYQKNNQWMAFAAICTVIVGITFAKYYR